jgi:tRNA pseudouridine55 synthase
MPLISQNILLIDKPKGITSFDVIRQLRIKLGRKNMKKMGHAGTLDPLASGLMIIGINEGTKELTKLIKLPKVYRAEILLGVQTETADMEGKIIAEKSVSTIDMEKVAEALRSMVGKIILPVPVYSAIKVKGQPLYKRARGGEVGIITPEKEMEVLWINLLEHFSFENHYVLRLELEVSSGTYIRALAEEIGRRLELPATIKELRRIKIGEFKITDAEKL